VSNLFYICTYSQDKVILSDGSLVDSPIQTAFTGNGGVSNGIVFRTFEDGGSDGTFSYIVSNNPIIEIHTYAGKYPVNAICINGDTICTVGYKAYNEILIDTSAILDINSFDVVRSSSLSNLTTWTSVCYGNGKYVAVGIRDGVNSIFFGTSSDGITWVENTISTTNVSNPQISFGNNTFLIVDGLRYISSDGTSWNTISDSNISYSGSVFTGESFLTYDETLYVSSDGITGVRKALPFVVSRIYSSNNMLLVYGETNQDVSPRITPIAISTDVGSSWNILPNIEDFVNVISLSSTTKPLFWNNYINTFES
jgi:hypothetical protein